jgi:hypothetical protein
MCTPEGLLDFLRLLGTDTSKKLALNCQSVYFEEKDPMLGKVRHFGRDPKDWSNPPADVVNFEKLIHYVHRVAAHLRSVKRFIDDGARLKPMLERYRVTNVGSRIPRPRPEIGSLSTIDEILRRISTSLFVALHSVQYRHSYGLKCFSINFLSHSSQRSFVFELCLHLLHLTPDPEELHAILP